MTQERKEASERLSEIWREWGISRDSQPVKDQQAALPALQELLASGDDAVMLRAVQALLADSERPGIAKRAICHPFWKCVREYWVDAGGDPNHVQGLQAMLIAVWPLRSRNIDQSLVALMSSPWEVLKGRQQQQARLQIWLNECLHRPTFSVGASSGKDNNRIEFLISKKIEVFLESSNRKRYVSDAAASDEGSFNEKEFLEHSIKVIEKYSAQNNYSYSAPHIHKVLDTFSNRRIRIEKLISDIQEILSRAPHRDVSKAQTELLWWGQARYCHSLRKPFRRIEDSEQCLWWAAWEAAKRSSSMPIESAAAYLQEVLHTLGHDLDEFRSLGDWLESLHNVLSTSESNKSLHVGDKIAELVKEDPLGLPVTWIRQRSAGSAFDRDEASTQIALPLDAEIDRGQWAAWILRELMLDRFFSEEE